MKEENKRVFVVLGMHRSGTSAITRGLQVLGIDLGDNLMQPIEENNPTGFWEDVDINALNIEMLSHLHSDWHFLSQIQPEDVNTLQAHGYLLRAIELLRKKTISSPFLGIKDPRISKLLPFWKEAFAQSQLKASYVLSIRNPLSVCASLAKRDGFDVERSHILWLEHVIGSLNGVTDENCIVVDYDNLMNSPQTEFNRLSKGLQMEIDKQELEKYLTGFLDKNLQHTVYRLSDLDLDKNTPPLVREVYTEVLDLACDRTGMRDSSFQQKLAHWNDELFRIQALLKLADKLETRIIAGNKQIAEKEQMAQVLSSQISEKEQTVQSLLEQISKWDAQAQVFVGQVQSLTSLVHEKNEQIGHLNQVLERETQESSTTLAEKETIAQSLSSQLKDKEQALQNLEVQMAEKNQALQGLRVQIAETEQNVQALMADLTTLHHSKEWKLILFLRKAWGPVVYFQRLMAPLLRQIRKIKDFYKQKKNIELVRKSGLFDTNWYLSQNPDIVQAKIDPLLHYLNSGGTEGRDPGPNFSSTMYLQVYPDVKKAGINPLVHYLQHGKKEGRKVLLPQAEQLVTIHHADFDPEWYLASYPDVAQAQINPYQHYLQHGRFEGRFGNRPKIEIQSGQVEFDPTKSTVLIVSHDASRTGAPILSLNIVQQLQKQHNVISLLLGSGSIMDYFLKDSTMLVEATAARGNALLADNVIEQLANLNEIQYAIVNSIESRAVLLPLEKRFIPTIHLVHEFAAYTRPRNAFPEALLWAHEVIFSASVTYENAIIEHPELTDRPCHIIPQGLCIIPATEHDPETTASEEARILSLFRPNGSADDDTIIVLGVGTVSLRKGVDLFIECAAQIAQTENGHRFRFIWIGNGFDPINDTAYSVYLADQIRRAGLQEHIYFMSETSNIEAAYRAADVLLLSSRLDPLPNVAIDAMMHRLPLVCFEKTTGIADILIEHSLGQACVSPYLDTADMANKVLFFANSKTFREETGEKLRQAASDEFNMEQYISKLENLAKVSVEHMAQEKADMVEIKNSGLARLDYFTPLGMTMNTDEALRHYVRTWAGVVSRRKLFPGFHPGIFVERHGLSRPNADPLADYLRAGRPSGPWEYEVLTEKTPIQPLPVGTRIALHLHVYYSDLLPEILAGLNINQVRPDLFVSVPSQTIQDEVQAMLAQNYHGKVISIQTVPNRGRDIGPFLTAFGPALADRYDLVGHFHTKKTADIQDDYMSRNWYQFLLENLLGSQHSMADQILGRLAADPTVGIIFPDDPHVVGWDLNRPYAEELAHRLGLVSLPEHFLFPVGTMFWARAEALRPLWALGLDWHDYPAEPLPYDGSLLHAVERLLPFVAAHQGFRPVLTNVKGITR